MGTLYVVATPIGNLDDVTTRAVQVLSDVALIAAEDTRHTGKLLAHLGIATPMLSYHAFNEQARRARLLAALSNGDVALVTDAGTPGVSDPGVELVDAALDAGFAVKTVPGPSALAAAASISGLLEGPFTFLGFLPRKATERAALLGRACVSGFGLVLFESPNRLGATLREISPLLVGRRFAVARELTKIYEEVRRGRFSDDESLTQFDDVRGEIVIVVESGEPTGAADDDPDAVLDGLLATGMRASDAAKEAARMTGRPRAELYRRAIERNKVDPSR